jgi:hypothetical protein
VGHSRNKRGNQNENKTYQNLWDTEKAVLRGKFLSKSAYIKRTEISQINNLMLHLKLRKTRANKTQIKQKEKNNKTKGQN